MRSLVFWAVICSCGTAIAVCDAPCPLEDIEYGSLVIFPEGQNSTEASSVICVVKDDAIIAMQRTNFQEPVWFTDVPVGEATVRIIPWFGYKTYFSDCFEVTIAKDKRTSFRLPIVPQPTVPFTLMVIDVDGKPLAKHLVWVGDISLKSADVSRLLDTDGDGKLTTRLCMNSRYRAVVRKGKSEQIRYATEFVPAEHQEDAKIVWQLRKPPVLRLRFCLDTGEEKKPLDNLVSVRVSNDKTGMTVPVHDAAIEITKAGPVVRGAKRIYVELVTIEGREHLRIKEPWIEVDDTEVQEVSVIVERTDTKE